MSLYFLDFEASSLEAGSYPIEIGWMNETGRGESYLIQPHRSWQGWSADSERVHHITQDMLRLATPVDIVARRARDVLTDATIISDQPAFDQFWLTMLLTVIGAGPLPVQDIQALLGQEIERVRDAIVAPVDSRDWHRQCRTLLDTAQMVGLTAYEGADAGLQPVHRALPDAQALWRGWRAARQAIDRLCEDVANGRV